MNYINEIYTLSQKFYLDYSTCTEILTKRGRTYNCLILEKKDSYFICIPFRSEIQHTNAYLFRNTQRSQTHKSGLDYTKTVLIKDVKYIGSVGLVDNDEYAEMMQNIQIINTEVNDYIDGYIQYVKNQNNSVTNNFKYRYTTLQYFHDILEI